MKIENSLIWVTSAKTAAGHKLELTFNDGSVKIFDCTPLIERYKIFEPLKNESVFENFSLDGWTVTWLDGQIDIAPEYLFSEGIAA
ncbi:MAG: DUF2442 domain-containing protein [Bacteroidales bacterium]|jgi:hypothetical protein|nr:DUF2442 domain-containing protein [Bacteroidales bacterium]